MLCFPEYNPYIIRLKNFVRKSAPDTLYVNKNVRSVDTDQLVENIKKQKLPGLTLNIYKCGLKGTGISKGNQ